MSGPFPNWSRPGPTNDKLADIRHFAQDLWPTFAGGIISGTGIVCSWNLTSSSFDANDMPTERIYTSPINHRIRVRYFYVNNDYYDYLLFDYDRNGGAGWEEFIPNRVDFTYSGDLLESYTWS